MMLFGFIILNLLIVFSSHLLVYRCCKNSLFSGQLVTTFLFYISQIIFSIIVLGSIIKELNALTLILLNGGISLTVIFILRKNIKPSLIDTREKIAGFSTWLVKSKDIFLYVFLFLFCFQLLVTMINIYYLPPFVEDVFSYHLHPVIDWFQQGQILSYTDTPVLRANENPLGTKLIHLWFVTFFKDITWIECPQFIFGIILSLSVYAAMAGMNISKKNALRYAVLIYFIPSVLLQSRTCQDHLVNTAYTFMALLYAVDVFFREREEHILPLLIVLGLLFGVKRHALLIIFVLFWALLLSRGMNRGRLTASIEKNRLRLIAAAGISMTYVTYIILTNKILYRQLMNRFSKLFTHKILLLFALALAVGLVLNWGIKKTRLVEYLKKTPVTLILIGILFSAFAGYGVIKYRDFLKTFILHSHTPVTHANRRNFPTKYPAFKSNLMKNLLAFPYRVKDIGLHTPYSPALLESSGFGVQFFTFGLISYLLLIPLCIFKKEYRNSIIGFLVLFSVFLLLAYFVVYYSWANYRVFIFFGVIGIIAWAFLLEKLNIGKYYSKYLDVLIVVMILFNGAACFTGDNMTPNRWKTVFSMNDPSERTSIKFASRVKNNKGRESWEYIDKYIEPGQHIGFSGGSAAWTFPYYDYHLKRRIYFIQNLPGFTTMTEENGESSKRILEFTSDFKMSLKQRGIHYIHFSTLGTSRRLKVFMPENADNVYNVTDNLYYYDW